MSSDDEVMDAIRKAMTEPINDVVSEHPGLLPYIVRVPRELLGKIDAAISDARGVLIIPDDLGTLDELA